MEEEENGLRPPFSSMGGLGESAAQAIRLLRRDNDYLNAQAAQLLLVARSCENGLLLQEAYEAAGLPLAVFIKPGCDHHPHGLADPTPVVEFILQHP